MHPLLTAILTHAKVRLGDWDAVADSIRRSRQTLAKIRNGQAQPGPEVCITLGLNEGLGAEEILKVLRAAGHGELADALVRLGVGADTLSEDERVLLKHARAFLRSMQAGTPPSKQDVSRRRRSR